MSINFLWFPLRNMAVAAPKAVSPHVKRVPSRAWVTGEYPGNIMMCVLTVSAHVPD